MTTQPVIPATDTFHADPSRVGLERRTSRNPIGAIGAAATRVRTRLATRRSESASRRQLGTQHELSQHSSRMRAKWDSHFMGF